ncbi:MAG: leucine-rich repeat protein [Oscillospiraceae bacterium]|nr:leucine-rich repeat protein [Oscillospiraceae bacterium]
MKHYRKLLAVLLCIAMCASMLPTWAFAEGGDGTGLAEEAGEADGYSVEEGSQAEEDLLTQGEAEDPALSGEEEMLPGAEAAPEAAGEEPVEEEETPEAAPPEDAPSEAVPEEPTEAPADSEEPKDDGPKADDPEEAEDEAPTETADLGDEDEGYAEMSGRICTVTVDDGTDNAALLDAYAQAALDSLRPGAVTPQNYRVDRGELLTGLDKKIYDALWKRIQQVASGDLASTAFVIPFEELGLKKTYTFDELGVTNFDDGFAMVDSFFDFSFRAVLGALLADCCYSLYWYDKTDGTMYQPYDSMSGSGNTIKVEGDGFCVWMSVVQEYWDGSSVYTYRYEDEYGDEHTVTKPTGVDPKYGTTVKTAVQNANAVVTSAAPKSDFDKLSAYKTWICDHVTYNDKAAQDQTVPYGNPWQLIWVFDGDIDTDVVCEGYSKAFQYLCELTSFQGAVGVYSVSGVMSGGTGAGNHMWNIVSMEDGKNYLVDVTNCDVGSIGAPDWLFMKGCAGGGVANGYTYNCGSGSFASQVTYVYDDEAKNLYGSDILTLSNKDYTPYADPTPADPELEDGKGVEITLGSENTASASRTLIFKPLATRIYEITAEDISNSGSNVTAASPYVVYPPVRVTLTTADGSTVATWASSTGTVSVRSTLTAGQEYRVTLERMSSGTGKYRISVKSFETDACGETAVWSYDTATAELTISGTGEMWPRSWTETGTDAPWTQYAGTASKLTVDDGITSLGEAAFMGMSALKEVSLPDSVKSLGLNAFRATGLTSIRLPDSIAMLEYATFSGCGALTEVRLPNQLESIGQAAFNGTAVEELDIPVSLTDIQYGAFETANSLKTVNYAGTKAQWSAIRIGDLNDCLKTALIHCTDGDIDNRPLLKLEPVGETGLTVARGTTATLTVRATPAKEGDTLTYDWYAVNRRTEDGRVAQTLVGHGSTSGNTNRLTTDPVTDQLQYVCVVSDQNGNSAQVTFTLDYGRQDGFAGDSIRWSVSGSVLTLSGTGEMWDYYYEDGFMTPWTGLNGSITEVIVGEGITAVGGDAFTQMPNLTRVTLPTTLTRIGRDAFSDSVSLKSIEFPASLRKIGSYAFYGSGLETVVLPEGLTEIGAAAFMGCAGLKEITLPKTLNTVPLACFSGCGTLELVKYAGRQTDWSSVSIADGNEPLRSAKLRCLGDLLKLSPPTDLAWHRFEEGHDVIGFMSFAQAAENPTRFYEYRIYRTVNGTDTMVRTDFTAVPGAGRDGNHVFVTSDEFESGDYYFTVTAVSKDPDKYADSDPVKSETWHYEKAAVRMATVTNIGIDTDGMATWTMPADLDHYTGFMMEYRYRASLSDPQTGEGMRYPTLIRRTMGPGDESPAVSFMARVRQQGPGYYQWRVKLLSDDTATVDKSLWSDWSAETQITAEQIAEYHAPNEFRNLKQLQKFCAQNYTSITSIRFGLNEPFEFTEDVVIPENLMVWFPAPNNSVTVPAGKTLTLNGSLLLQEDITVAGTLVNNSTLALHNGNGAMATVTVTGSYAGTGRLYVNHIGKGHVADADPDTYFTGIDLRNYERSHTDSDNKECVYIYTWNPALKAGETLTLDLSSAQPKSSFRLVAEEEGLYVITLRKLSDSAARPGIHLSATNSRVPDSQVLWDGETMIYRYSMKAGETLPLEIERTGQATGEGSYELSAAVFDLDACGDRLTWAVSGDTLTISGEGDIWDYTEVGYPADGGSVNWTTDAPWGDYEDTVKTVTLDPGVTAVGQNAFAGMNALETLAVSASAAGLRVGKWAFDQCDNLQRIELNGFSSDWKEDRIAEGNESLTGAKLYCEYGLAVQPKDGKETAIAVPCGTTVTLEVETVPAQGGGAIRYAWSSATDWTEDGSTQIINYENNSPSLVTEPVDTFRVYTCTVTDELGNEGAVSFRVQYERPEGYVGNDIRWAVSNGVLTLSGTGAMWDYYYENGMMLPWAARSAEITKVVVEAGITVIGGYAFSYLPNLTEVSLPEGLVSIHADAFTDCVSLRGIDLPSTLTELRRYVFYGSGLESMVLPEGLAALPEGGFMGCTGLAEVTVPKSLTAVEEACFTGCEELKTVNYAGTPAEWNRIRIAEGNEALTQAFKAQFGAGDSSGLKLNKEYLLIQKGGTDSSLNVTEGLNDYTKKYLTWTTESGREDIIAVDRNTGAVMAKSVGTDYAVATLDLGYAVYTARCRVDIQESITELSEVKASLTEDKVTVELYRTDYTRVGIVLAIEQNRIGAASIGEAGTDADADTNSPADPAVSAVLKKVTWEAADKNKITDFFELEQVDDRYVQIVPKDLSPLAVKATKGSYKASILVTVDDGTENGRELDPLPLTVTVKKTLPKLSAPAVKLNRFTPDEVVPVAVTGANVTGFRPENGNYKNTVAELSKELPMTVKLNPANTKNGSAKFSLICDLENWAVTAKLNLTVSSTWNAPKVTLKPTSVNLYSGNGNDKAFSAVTVTPLAGMTHRIEAVGNNGLIADYDDETGVITVEKGKATAGNATVTVKADGQPVATLRVKVQAAAAKTGITAKAAGAIDLKMTNSPVTITLTGKNCNAGAVTDYDVHILCNNRKQGVKDLDVTDLFNIEITRDVITLREKRDPALKQSLKDVFDKGDAYTAVIETAAAEIKPVKITVKNSAKVTINVSYKTVGTIDVLRQGTSVTVTPTVKNWYERDLEQGDLHIYDSAYKDITDKFTVGFDGAAYRVTPKEALNPKLKYYAAVPKDVTGAQSTVYKALTVKMGTAKIAQSTKAITLSKNDLYDRQSVVLSVNDPTLYDIGEARVVLVDKSGCFAQPVHLGNGEFAIGFVKDRTIDVTKMKSANVQLQVFLGGNITDTPNARLSVKITLK